MDWLKVIAFCLISPLLLIGVVLNGLIDCTEFNKALERMMK